MANTIAKKDLQSNSQSIRLLESDLMDDIPPDGEGNRRRHRHKPVRPLTIIGTPPHVRPLHSTHVSFGQLISGFVISVLLTNTLIVELGKRTS